jgi:nitrate/nitrite transporter NarK
VGTAAAAAGVSVAAHLLAVAVAGFAGALVAGGSPVRDPDHRARAALERPSRRPLVLGSLAFCAFAIDGAAFNWSAVDLRREHDAGAGTAAAAFTGFALAIAIGRGFAAVAPTLLGAAPQGEDASPAAAIAAVSAIGYLGSFVAPPAIGALAQTAGLSAALLSLVAVSALLGALARPALASAESG